MKKLPILILFCNLAHAYPADVSVCFTPGDRCDEKIIGEINHAKTSVLVQAYQLTSQPIQDALSSDNNRGVKVLVILDKSQVSSKKMASAARFFYDNKIPVWIDRKPRIAHNKIMIIDGKEVITGSYNFSHAAQFNNAENVVFIKSPEISSQYEQNFNSRLKKSFEFNPEK
jgi:phosphatidylserine/phosphatidylglycerophosphate/cardiolipin synthase-like enzyme